MCSFSGFRRNCSANEALSRLVSFTKEEICKTGYRRGYCLFVMVDINDAFNSAPWKGIVGELEKKKVLEYIIRMVESYLTNRKMVHDDGSTTKVTAGVPQGSVLGPTLWNILYDGVLMLRMPDGVKLTAYADDLDIMANAKEESDLETSMNRALSLNSDWMALTDLTLAPEKTEAILLIGKTRCRPLDITLGVTKIQIKSELKYLGVTLDKSLRF